MPENSKYKAREGDFFFFLQKICQGELLSCCTVFKLNLKKMKLFLFSIWQKSYQFGSIWLDAAVLRNKTNWIFWPDVLHLMIIFIHAGLSKRHNGYDIFITSFVGNSLLYRFCCMWGIRLAMHKVQLNRQNPDHFHNKSSLSFHPDLCARQRFHNFSKPYIQNVYFSLVFNITTIIFFYNTNHNSWL